MNSGQVLSLLFECLLFKWFKNLIKFSSASESALKYHTMFWSEQLPTRLIRYSDPTPHWNWKNPCNKKMFHQLKSELIYIWNMQLSLMKHPGLQLSKHRGQSSRQKWRNEKIGFWRIQISKQPTLKNWKIGFLGPGTVTVVWTWGVAYHSESYLGPENSHIIGSKALKTLLNISNN